MKKFLLGAAALIAAGLANVPAAEAAQGCGPGYGRDSFGYCRPFWGPRPAYRHYGWHGPRHYRPVRYGWHGHRHYRPVRYGYGPRYYRPVRYGYRPYQYRSFGPVISVGFGRPFW
jgi:hypothetical protein